MKLFTYIFSVIAILLIVFNFGQIDFNNPFQNESIIAVITVIAGLCALFLMAILRISKKIEKLQKRKP